MMWCRRPPAPRSLFPHARLATGDRRDAVHAALLLAAGEGEGRCWSVLLLSTGIPAGDQVGRFRPFQPRSSLGLSFRGVEKESRDDYLEEASSDRTAMCFVALTDHLLDHVGNTAAPSR